MWRIYENPLAHSRYSIKISCESEHISKHLLIEWAGSSSITHLLTSFKTGNTAPWHPNASISLHHSVHIYSLAAASLCFVLFVVFAYAFDTQAFRVLTYCHYCRSPCLNPGHISLSSLSSRLSVLLLSLWTYIIRFTLHGSFYAKLWNLFCFWILAWGF